MWFVLRFKGCWKSGFIKRLRMSYSSKKWTMYLIFKWVIGFCVYSLKTRRTENVFFPTFYIMEWLIFGFPLIDIVFYGKGIFALIRFLMWVVCTLVMTKKILLYWIFRLNKSFFNTHSMHISDDVKVSNWWNWVHLVFWNKAELEVCFGNVCLFVIWMFGSFIQLISCLLVSNFDYCPTLFWWPNMFFDDVYFDLSLSPINSLHQLKIQSLILLCFRRQLLCFLSVLCFSHQLNRFWRYSVFLHVFLWVMGILMVFS